MSRSGSCLFVFACADKNDKDKEHEIINLINNKSMKVIYFPREQHGGRRHPYVLNLSGNKHCIPKVGMKGNMMLPVCSLIQNTVFRLCNWNCSSYIYAVIICHFTWDTLTPL